jgi:hypothetical protein
VADIKSGHTIRGPHSFCGDSQCCLAFSWLEKHSEFLTTFGAVARIEDFTIKSVLIGDGRELQLTTGTRLEPQRVFAGMTVEMVNNAVRSAAREGIYVPTYAPGLIAMFDSPP